MVTVIHMPHRLLSHDQALAAHKVAVKLASAADALGQPQLAAAVWVGDVLVDVGPQGVRLERGPAAEHYPDLAAFASDYGLAQGD